MIGEYFDGLVQDGSNSIANALELLQSFTKSSIYWDAIYLFGYEHSLVSNWTVDLDIGSGFLPFHHWTLGPLFTKRTDVLPPYLGKSRSREIGWHNDRSDAAEVPTKFRSDWKSLNPNLAGSRFHEIMREEVGPLCE